MVFLVRWEKLASPRHSGSALSSLPSAARLTCVCVCMCVCVCVCMCVCVCVCVYVCVCVCVCVFCYLWPAICSPKGHGSDLLLPGRQRRPYDMTIYTLPRRHNYWLHAPVCT